MRVDRLVLLPILRLPPRETVCGRVLFGGSPWPSVVVVVVVVRAMRSRPIPAGCGVTLENSGRVVAVRRRCGRLFGRCWLSLSSCAARVLCVYVWAYGREVLTNVKK